MKKLVAFISIASIILAGCSANNQNSKKDTLNVELPLKTTTLAPYETDVPVKIGAVETLFKSTANGKIKKVLVDSYKQPSAKKLDITLKDNIKFQNGNKLTAKAVKESLEESSNKSDLVKGSLPIKNITAHGQHLTITTKHNYPELVSELASPFAAIYDVNAKNSVNKQPVGTGAYSIKNYKQSQKIALDRNNKYWQGKPKMKHVNVTYQEDGNVRASDLKSGKADVITDVPVEKVKTLKDNDKTKVSDTSGFRTGLILYNHTSKKMTKPVRQALDKVIDRQGITKKISKGYAKPAAGPFNDKAKYINEGLPQKQDIQGAKKLLSKAGYDKQHPLKITVPTYNGRPELPKIAQVLQSDAKKANIDIDIRNVDDIEGYLKDKKQWDASMYSFGTLPRGDTGYFFNQAYKSGGAINKGDYHNERVNQLIDQLNETVKTSERHNLSNDIIKLTDKDYANSYITYNDTLVGLNKNVKNLTATPEGIYLVDYKVDKAHDN